MSFHRSGSTILAVSDWPTFQTPINTKRRQFPISMLDTLGLPNFIHSTKVTVLHTLKDYSFEFIEFLSHIIFVDPNVAS